MRALRKPNRSSSCTPHMVEPPGEHTWPEKKNEIKLIAMKLNDSIASKIPRLLRLLDAFPIVKRF